MHKLSWLLLLALLQGPATLRNPQDGAVAVIGTNADVICQDSEAGFLVQLTSKVDADFALVRVFYRKKVEAMSESLVLNHTEVVAVPIRGGTVMLDPFPTKQAEVQKVVVTWLSRTQEETFTTGR